MLEGRVWILIDGRLSRYRPSPTLALDRRLETLTAFETARVFWFVYGYKVQIATSSTFTDTSLVYYQQVSGDTSFYAPPAPLDTNTTYYWRVSSFNVLNQYSLWSAIRHFHTRVPGPQLNDPAGAAALSTPVSLSWKSVDKAANYRAGIGQRQLQLNGGQQERYHA
jgi:hypothetical protein